MSTDKLQKVMAAAGLGSRRAMEQWISDGRALINGRKAKLGDRVGFTDRITVDGELLKRASHNAMIQCLIYHKPEGEICAVTDPKGRPTVFENLPPLEEGRWVSVGRLDFNTSGLLLFTNNGDLANKLMHPSANLTRRYMARIRGDLDQKDVQTITRKGVMLDGKPARFEEVKVMDRITPGANNWIEVSIKEGRYREVRRILEAVDHPVSRLKRTQYGTVKLTTAIRMGKFERMAPLQLEKLLLAHNLHDFLPKVRKANIGKVFKVEEPQKQEKSSRSSSKLAQRKSRDSNGGKAASRQSESRQSATKQPAARHKYSRSSDGGAERGEGRNEGRGRQRDGERSGNDRRTSSDRNRSDKDRKPSNRSTKPKRRTKTRQGEDSNSQSKAKRGKRTRS